MPNSSSILAYPDVKEALQRALESSAGIRVIFDSAKGAFHFIGRCNSFRGLDRKENLVLYEPGNPMHGKSPFDTLRIAQDKRDKNVVLIEPLVSYWGKMTKIEEI